MIFSLGRNDVIQDSYKFSDNLTGDIKGGHAVESNAAPINALNSDRTSDQTSDRTSEQTSDQPTSLAAKLLPQLTIDNQSFSPPAQEGFIGALRHSFAYGLVQAPLQGVAQVIDHTAGQAFHTSFYDRTKDLLIKAPEEARFGSADWYGQTFGGALAVLPWFILTRNGLRAAEGASAVTRGLVVASEEAASAKTFFETAGFKTTLESGLTGAAYSGLFRPTNDSDTNYWQAKTQMMTKDFVTFSALTASSMSIASKLNYYVALPMVQDSAIMKDIAAKGVAITTGILSAGPAAVAGTTVDLITNAGQKPLRFQDFAKDVYSYAVVGAGLSVMPSGGKGKALHHEKDYGPYSNGADWKASVDHFNNHEIDSKALQVSDAFSNSLYMRLFAKGKHPYIESVDFGQGFEKTKFAGSMHDINDSNIVSTKDLSETFAHMPNAFTFKKAIGDRYVGTLPEGLDGRFDAERKQILANLDLLAKALRSLDGNLPPQKKYGQGAFDLGLEPFKISLGEEEVEVSKIGTGEVSHVYKLKSENKEYAFKVTSDPSRMDIHGSYAETAAFVHLAGEKVSDLIDFHAAHPGPGAGWILTEYVSRPVSREGKPLSEILAKSGFKLGDDWAPNRGPGNVVWDVGGIEPSSVRSPRTLDELKILLKTDEGKFIAGRKLDAIKDQAELKQALIICLQQSEISGQVARTAAKNLTSPGDLRDVLSQALETKGAAGRAAFELDRLANTPYISDLFYKALHNPESRLEAAKMIDQLPTAERAQAFDAAFAYPEARAMAARSLPSLPAGEASARYAEALKYPGSSYVIHKLDGENSETNTSEKVKTNRALQHFLESQNLTVIHKEEMSEDHSFAKWASDNNLEPNAKKLLPVKEIWEHLTEAQRTLPAKELTLIAWQYNQLRPAQWKTLTPEEAVTITKLIPQLLHEQAEKIIQTPALLAKLSQIEPTELINRLSTILTCWDELPTNFKTLSGEDLVQVGKVWHILPDHTWENIQLKDVTNVARAIHTTRLQDDDTDVEAPRKLSQFASWYAKNETELQAVSPTELRAVLSDWNNLSTDAQTMQPRQLVDKAVRMHNETEIKNLFGNESKTSAFLNALPPQAFKNVTAFCNDYVAELQSDAIRLQARANIESLVEKAAPAADFDRLSLEQKLFKDLYLSGDKNSQELFDKLSPDRSFMQTLFDFMSGNGPQNAELLKIALKRDLTIYDGAWQPLYALKHFIKDMPFEHTGDLEHLFKLQEQGLNFEDLTSYLEENPAERAKVRDLISNRADRNLIQVSRLADQKRIEKLPGFSEGEKAKLRDLNKDGLSIIKLSNYLRFDPARESTIKVLIKHGADATLINDVLRLSVFPANNAVELAYWAHNNKIRIEDVLGKVKDFSAGKAFHQLLIRRLDNGEGLSGAILDHLFNQAESATKTDFPTSSLHPAKNATSEQSIGESFFMAAESIMETIPSEKPIVLLGRDAGPLVPLLRALGRDNVHYFIWSRLQCGDPQTGEQWLKEIPPGAAVIDTGYMGSIINTIQHLDPGTSGYLLASSNPAYPALLKTQENNVRVDQIEQTPKLIVRGSAHNKNGGVIARKRHSENDVDSTFHDSEKNSRWSKERNAREILRAAGLDEWDAWRYSSWVGLTPKDRLGLRTDAQVQQHYQDVARARNTATASAQ